jgi:riboflavin synthase
VFTGLIEEAGVVAEVGPAPEGARLTISAAAVLEVTGGGFAADCVAETLRRTSLGSLRAGDRVNLERPMRLGDRLDGHMVQGHVDGVGRVRGVRGEGESTILEIAPPAPLLRYIVEKGSIAVDGVSLTVAERLPDAFTVALIPHTMGVTTLGPGARDRPVNLEVDVLAKYVESLVAPYAPPREERA